MRNNPIHIPTVKKIFENFYPNACGFKKKLYLCTRVEQGGSLPDQPIGY